MSGLEGQLLGVTIQHEKPELEKQKSTLLAAEDELKIQVRARARVRVEVRVRVRYY